MSVQNDKDNHYLLNNWRPENKAFWENKGQAIARRNLWISVTCLLLAFCVWMLFSAVAVNLNKVGFHFTTDQLFINRPAFTFRRDITGPLLLYGTPFGGRYWTVLSTVILIVPCIWLGGNPEYYYSVLGIYYYCAAVRFCRSEFCFQHGKYQLFPQSETGQRAGSQRRPWQSGRKRDADGRPGGHLPAALHLLGVHGVTQPDGSTITLSNAALVWVPLLLLATVAAWFGMNDIAGSKASIRDQLPVLKRPHMWLLSLLYLATFGSFIGFSAGFAMLAKTQFPAVDILKLAFFGPFIGALARSFGGIISDRLGGVRVTLVNFVLMALFTGLLFLTLPCSGSGSFSLSTWCLWGSFNRRSGKRLHLPDDRRHLPPAHHRQRKTARRQR